MAELSNHSYHYNRNLLVSLPPFEPQMDLFDSLLPDNMSSLSQISPSLENNQEDLDLDETGERGKGKNSKKKPRRKRRNLTGVSKQRRAANERERKRLQIINMAFKDLKAALPLFPNENNISKIEIVRLASRTIKYLSELANNDSENDTMNNMDNSRSPGGSVTSDHSESGSSLSNPSPRPDFEEEAKLLAPGDIDISNLLSNYEELSSMAVDMQSPSMLEPVTMVGINELKPLTVKKEESRSSCKYATPTVKKEESRSSCRHATTVSRSQKSGSTGSISNFNSTSSSTSSTSDGFSGFDINIFLDDSAANSEDSKDDVFPSMLSFW